MIKDEAQVKMRTRGNGWEYEEEKIIVDVPGGSKQKSAKKK